MIHPSTSTLLPTSASTLLPTSAPPFTWDWLHVYYGCWCQRHHHSETNECGILILNKSCTSRRSLGFFCEALSTLWRRFFCPLLRFFLHRFDFGELVGWSTRVCLRKEAVCSTPLQSSVIFCLGGIALYLLLAHLNLFMKGLIATSKHWWYQTSKTFQQETMPETQHGNSS